MNDLKRHLASKLAKTQTVNTTTMKTKHFTGVQEDSIQHLQTSESM